MPKSGKILIVDDDEDVLRAARLFLKRHVLEVVTESDPYRIPQHMQVESFDVILLDMNFTEDVSSGLEGLAWLDKILEIDPSAVVILITAYGGVELAVKAIKEGAVDFVVKPWENEKLLATVLSATKLRASRKEVDRLQDRQQVLNRDIQGQYIHMIGQSSAMEQVFETIELVAKTDANVLILGENGTGKELVAKAIHQQSERKDAIFVKVDLGAISESLFESELFGHLKGAFTDAKTSRPGRFEAASGGTLFLDEIGNLSPPMQSKLLTAIQSRKVTRIGSNTPVEVDIRLLCATNMPLYEMVEERSFRQDLLYRINTIELTLPPLRERVDDIPLLADFFLKEFGKKYGRTIRKLKPALLKRMQKYPWPGNVRELRHAMERAVILSKGPELDTEDVLLHNRSSNSSSLGLNIEGLSLEEAEKTLIRKALEKHQGNISHAAEELGITRSSLYRRLEKYGL